MGGNPHSPGPSALGLGESNKKDRSATGENLALLSNAPVQQLAYYFGGTGALGPMHSNKRTGPDVVSWGYVGNVTRGPALKGSLTSPGPGPGVLRR